MARIARLTVPGLLHLVVQRGHDGGDMVRDEHDTQRLLQALRDAAAAHHVTLHAYGLTPGRLVLLLTPTTTRGVSRMVQSVGRHYAAGFNRRHGRQGAVWAGRFACTVVEAGDLATTALLWVDRPTTGDGSPCWTSASGRLGGPRDPSIVDPPAYWQLGNTPFDRQARYQQLLSEPAGEQAQRLLAALATGRPCGSAAFVQAIANATGRDLTVRPRGRPRRSTSTAAAAD